MFLIFFQLGWDRNFFKILEKNRIFFIVQNEFVSSKIHNIPSFDTFPKNKFYKNYLKRAGFDRPGACDYPGRGAALQPLRFCNLFGSWQGP